MARLSLHELSEGMVLGEDVILRDGTFLSKGLVLSQSSLERLSESSLSSFAVDRSEAIDKVCTPQAIKKLPHLEHRVYHEGEYLFLQGQESSEIFLLIAGALEVVYTPDSALMEELDSKKAMELVDAGGRRVAQMKRPMTVVGEMGPLLCQRRSTSIKASIPTHVAIIPATGEEFRNTLMNNPKLGLNIAVGLAQRMEESLDNINLFEVLSATLQELLSRQPAKFKEVVDQITEISESVKIVAFKVLAKDLQDFSLYRQAFRYSKSKKSSLSSEFTESQCFKTELDLFPEYYLKEFDSGELLCQPGDDADYIYILHWGRLGVLEKEKILLHFKDQGDTLGTVKALSGYQQKPRRKDLRNRTVKALTGSRVLVLPVNSLEEIAKKYPAVIVHICKSLAARLTESNQEMTAALSTLDEGIQKAYGSTDSILIHVKIAISQCETVDPDSKILGVQIKALEKICASIETLRSNYDELLVSVHSHSTLEAG